MMAQPRRPYRQRELPLHEAFLQHCSLRLPREAFTFHVPMGGKRSAATGSLLKRMGAVAGFPDVAILLDSRLYCVELKSDRGRVLGLLESWGLLPEARR
jgi:hypothetical protein